MSMPHTSPDSSATNPAYDSGDDGGPPPIDYRGLREAARLATAWLSDVARSGAPAPEDRDAIDRVESAALATLAGMPMCDRPAELRASEEDVLVTAGILIERFEIDFRIPGLSEIFGSLYESLDWSQRSTAAKTGGVTPGRATGNHATHRHAREGIPTWISMWLSQPAARGPRVAHGTGESTLARILVFPLR